MRIFIAGASGLIGIRLVAPLVSAGHVVAGMTRSPGKAARLSELGAEPVICDVFDAEALNRAVGAFRPDVVFHQLTDLPDDAGAMPEFRDRNDRIREEGTHNLLAAAAAAGAGRVIAQSVSWELAVVTRAYESAIWSELPAPTASAARPPTGKVIRGSVWPKSTLASTGRPARRS